MRSPTRSTRAARPSRPWTSCTRSSARAAPSTASAVRYAAPASLKCIRTATRRRVCWRSSRCFSTPPILSRVSLNQLSFTLGLLTRGRPGRTLSRLYANPGSLSLKEKVRTSIRLFSAPGQGANQHTHPSTTHLSIYNVTTWHAKNVSPTPISVAEHVDLP